MIQIYSTLEFDMKYFWREALRDYLTRWLMPRQCAHRGSGTNQWINTCFPRARSKKFFPLTKVAISSRPPLTDKLHFPRAKMQDFFVCEKSSSTESQRERGFRRTKLIMTRSQNARKTRLTGRKKMKISEFNQLSRITAKFHRLFFLNSNCRSSILRIH